MGLEQTPELMADATEGLLVMAQLAREDSSFFFELVMREEHTQTPIVTMPHQKVLFSFIDAFPHCVIRLPVGASKTFCMTAMGLKWLGEDPSARGAIISATQGQAAKPLKMMADYITHPMLAAALRLVYPHLRRTQRIGDPWMRTAITVDRPPGIRDPSVTAIGIDGQLPGARLKWALVDDVLDRENTSTPAGRDKVFEFFDSTVLSRLDPEHARLVVMNTPWHPDDATYRLERAGWPTLTMNIDGDITLTNVPPEWDTDEIQPSIKPGEVYRLTAHGEDAEEAVPLWPERFSRERIEELRKEHLPHRFNQLYMCRTHDEQSARCKIEWIDKCKRAARAAGAQLVSRYEGKNLTVTGVDLAVGMEARHDKTAFVTLELLPTGKRRILDVETGRWDGPTIVAKLIRKQRQYNSIVRVETNAAQKYIQQFTLAAHASIPVKCHNTGKNKMNPQFGIESIFIELSNGAWLIPCDKQGHCHKHVQELVDDWLYYDASKHTGDAAMAAWLAREQGRELGDGRLLPQHSQSGRSVSMGIMAR